MEQLTVAQDRLLTPKEAAQYLSMTERFLESRRTRGDGLGPAAFDRLTGGYGAGSIASGG